MKQTLAQERRNGYDLLLADLGTWKRLFGTPAHLDQADGGTTFFFWRDSGIAAFTHPLLEDQYRSRAEDDRQVTSIVVPLQPRVHAVVAPGTDDAVLDFSKLIPLRVAGTPASDLSASDWRRLGAGIVPFRARSPEKRIRPTACLIDGAELRVHLSQSGDPELLELVECSPWTRYD